MSYYAVKKYPCWYFLFSLLFFSIAPTHQAIADELPTTLEGRVEAVLTQERLIQVQGLRFIVPDPFYFNLLWTDTAILKQVKPGVKIRVEFFKKPKPDKNGYLYQLKNAQQLPDDYQLQDY